MRRGQWIVLAGIVAGAAFWLTVERNPTQLPIPGFPPLEGIPSRIVAAIEARHRHAVVTDSGEAWQRYGDVLLAQRQRDYAEDAYLRAAAVGGGDRFTALYLAGIASMRMAPTRAATTFTAALRLKDDYAPAHLSRATVAEELGDLDAAARHFRIAFELEPTSHALVGLGRVELARGRPESAVDLFRRARDVDPTHFEVDVALARALRRLGRVADSNAAAARVPLGRSETEYEDPYLYAALLSGSRELRAAVRK